MGGRWPEVLDTVLRQRGRALFGYAYLLTGSAEDAEDLVQSALVKTFSRSRRYPSPAAAEAYVRAAIRTLFIDDRRLARHRMERTGIEADAGCASGTGRVDSRMVLQRALNALAPRERACIVLRFYDDLTTDAISRELGLASGTVRRYLSDGVRNLERAIGDLGLDASDLLFGGTETVPVIVTHNLGGIHASHA